MKSWIAAASVCAVVGLAAPAVVSANVVPTCTDTGVAITLVGFKGAHVVPWEVARNGVVLASGTARVDTTDVSFNVPISTSGPVIVHAAWGVGTRYFNEQYKPSEARCPLTSPVAPSPPNTPPSPPVEPSIPVVPLPPVVEVPMTPKKVNCGDLVRRKVGLKTLIKKGCVTKRIYGPKRCPKAWKTGVAIVRHSGKRQRVRYRVCTPSRTHRTVRRAFRVTG